MPFVRVIAKTKDNDSLLNGGNLNLITHLIPNFRFSVPHQGGTTVPFETYHRNLLFAFAIFVSGVHLISSILSEFLPEFLLPQSVSHQYSHVHGSIELQAEDLITCYSV